MKTAKVKAQRLFVPELGTQLQLAEDWPITLHYESRNNDFIYKLGGPHITRYGEKGEYKTVLEKGTILTVDRIYIRSGAKAFSSISFRVAKGKVKGRFWVKLAEANQIMFVRVAGQKLSYKVTDTLTTSKNNTIEASSRSSLANKMNYWRRYYQPDFSFQGIFFSEVKPVLEKEGRWKFTGSGDNWILEAVNSSEFLEKRSSYGFGSGPKVYETYVNTYKLQAAYQDDFLRVLKQIKGVKSLAALLDVLPPRYKYEEIESDI